MIKKRLTLQLCLFILLGSIQSTAQVSTTYSWSTQIETGKSYNWVVTQYEVQTTGNISGIQENIEEGMKISIVPIVELSSISVNFISIEANVWSSYFNYSINDIQIEDPEDYLFYNFLIMPIIKDNDGAKSNIFEDEIVSQDIFPGEISNENGIFKQKSNSTYISEGQNTTEIGNLGWEVTTGLLQNLKVETFITTDEFELNGTINIVNSNQLLSPQLSFPSNLISSRIILYAIILIGSTFLTTKFYFMYVSAKKVKILENFSGSESLSSMTLDIISKIFGESSKYYYLIAANLDEESKIEINSKEFVLTDLKNYKFLMHPIRFAMCRILVEHNRIPTAKIREILDITWSDLSTHTRTMKEKKFIYIESIIIGDKFTQVISLESKGIIQFQELSLILSNLIDTM